MALVKAPAAAARLYLLARLFITSCTSCYQFSPCSCYSPPNPMFDFFMKHAALQFVLFTAVAVIPCCLTGAMLFVDVVWPFGLSIIGVYSYLYTVDASSSDTTIDLRRVVMCSCYAIHGARMGVGALFMIATGNWDLKKDLSRYAYQKIRFEHFNPGKEFSLAHKVFDIYLQCIANGAFLFLPCFLVASSSARESLTALEMPRIFSMGFRVVHRILC